MPPVLGGDVRLRHVRQEGRGARAAPDGDLLGDLRRGSVDDLDLAGTLARHVDPPAVGTRGDPLGLVTDLDRRVDPPAGDVDDRRRLGVLVRDVDLRPVARERELLRVRSGREALAQGEGAGVDHADAVRRGVRWRQRPGRARRCRRGPAQRHEDARAVGGALDPARPLADVERRELLARRGIEDADRARPLVAHEGEGPVGQSGRGGGGGRRRRRRRGRRIARRRARAGARRRPSVRRLQAGVRARRIRERRGGGSWAAAAMPPTAARVSSVLPTSRPTRVALRTRGAASASSFRRP